jgi:hypothetical protein
MKHPLAVVAVIALASWFGTNNAIARSNGNSGGSNSVAPAAHYSSTTTTVAPHFNAMPRFSGANPYRPTVSYRSGLRTLNYPPVGNSMLRQQIHPNVNGLNSSYALQRSANFHQARSFTQGLAPNTIGRNRLDPQTSARLRNWSGNISSASQAHLNHLNNFHHHHDRDWWKDHCAAIIFFDFGWWGWYDGWWYPAWGYDPYSYYDYNEPIYGYDGLSPEQIVASVQAQLQQLGYYSYAIDGRMGPLTRAAIARYQRDHRLPITYGIDQTTLGSLGIIH